MKKLLFLSILIASYFTIHAQGLIRSKEKYEKADKWQPKKEFGFAGKTLPTQISYRKYCPSVKSQGDVGTCVGWATAYAALSTQQNIQMNITNGTQKWARAFDPNFLYNWISEENDKWCQKGSTIIDALNILTKYGCKPLVWEPWLECDDSITFDEFTLAVASKYKISNAYSVAQEDLVENVKWALSEKMPVIVGVDLTESFVSGKSMTYGVWIPSKDEVSIGGHAMCVIGYNDTKNGGSFEVMNSYGSNFGDKGFIWIKYSDFKARVSEAYVMETQTLSTDACSLGDCENGFSRYTYDTGEIYEGMITDKDPDVWGSCVYTTGSTYIGGWKAGRKNGWGLVYDIKTEKFYDTYYRNDVLTKSNEKGFAMSAAESKSQQKITNLKKATSIKTEESVDFEELQKILSKLEAPDKPLTISKAKKTNEPKKKSKYKASKNK